MYKLELDVALKFDPPMRDDSPGILVTRTVDLPFIPFEGLALYSGSWDGWPEPRGLKLQDVVWDVDRGTFLATSVSAVEGMPIASIPAELSDWVGRGWRFGSYNDTYNGQAKPAKPKRLRQGPLAKAACDLQASVSDDVYAEETRLPSQQSSDDREFRSVSLIGISPEASREHGAGKLPVPPQGRPRALLNPNPSGKAACLRSHSRGARTMDTAVRR
jgi:hypothetical protein